MPQALPRFARLQRRALPMLAAVMLALPATAALDAQTAAAPAATPIIAPPPVAAPPVATPQGTASASAEGPPLLFAPIQLDAARRMLVQVRIGGQGPYGFIVDTGAERTVVSRELAAHLRLASAGRARVIGIAEAVMADLFHVDALSLNNVDLSQGIVPAFAQNDIGAPGLIGIDSLENHKLMIDFIAGSMDVRPSTRSRSRYREEDFDSDAITVVARRSAGRMILSNAELDGHRIDIIVDTGAQSSVGNLALRRLVMRQRGQSGRLGAAQLTSVTGATLAVQTGQIERISVGGVDFTNLPVAYADSPAFAVLGLQRRPALLLGMDALRLFDRVLVDFPNRRVTFDLPGAGRVRGDRYALTTRPSGG